MIYLLTGSDKYSIELEIDRIKAKYLTGFEEVNYIQANTIAEANNLSRELPFGSKSRVVVLRSKFNKDDSVERPASMNVLVIVVEGQLNKFLKDLKKESDVISNEFNLINSWDTKDIKANFKQLAAQYKVEIDNDALDLMVKRIGNDSARTHHEFKRLALFNRVIDIQTINKTVVNMQISAFDLAEFILEDNYQTIYLLNHCLSVFNHMDIVGSMIYKIKELLYSLTNPYLLKASDKKIYFLSNKARKYGFTKLALLYRELVNCQNDLILISNKDLRVMECVFAMVDITRSNYSNIDRTIKLDTNQYKKETIKSDNSEKKDKDKDREKDKDKESKPNKVHKPENELDNKENKSNNKLNELDNKEIDFTNPDYIYIQDQDTFNKYLTELINSNPQLIAIDTETTVREEYRKEADKLSFLAKKDSKIFVPSGLDPHTGTIRILQIASLSSPVLIIDAFKVNLIDNELLIKLMRSDCVKIAHNWVFDWQILRAIGVKVRNNLFDTQIAEQLLFNGIEKPKGYYSLAGLSQRYLDYTMNKEEQRSDWSKELTDSQIRYAAIDANTLIPLYKLLKVKLIENKLDVVAKIEFDCVSAVAEIQFNGMKIDMDIWNELFNRIAEQKDLISKEIHKVLKPSNNGQLSLFGGTEFDDKVNLDSPSQLLKALNENGIEVYSTTEKVLRPLTDKHDILYTILDYKKYAKSISSFGEPVPKMVNIKTKRIHPSYWQMKTRAGRFSCSNPNVQQIPRDDKKKKLFYRSCFVPRKGYKYVIADYSQIELRIAAHISQDETLIEAYKNDIDVHSLTAASVLNKPIEEVTKEERQLGKPTNFGLIYGQSSEGYKSYSEAAYGVRITLKEAEEFRDKYFTLYSGVKRWHSQIWKDCERMLNDKTKMPSVRTLTGRRRWFPDPDQVYLNPLSNTPVQGTGADILKLALGRLQDALEGLDANLVGTVHDEIILEVLEEHAEEASIILKNVMEAAGNAIITSVPIIAEVSIGDSWSDK